MKPIDELSNATGVPAVRLVQFITKPDSVNQIDKNAIERETDKPLEELNLYVE